MKTILTIATVIVALALLFVLMVYPAVPYAAYTFATILLVLLVSLVWKNQKNLKDAVRSRSIRYGANTVISTALIVAILVVLNFLNYNHFIRKDLTKEKMHTLSEQSIKILKGLKQDIKMVVFSRTVDREAIKPRLDNYQYYNKKLSVEYIDPSREPTRAQSHNVKKQNTIIVTSGTRETRVDDFSADGLTEEKITNAIIKVVKDRKIQVCFMSGHGEKGIDAAEADTYSQIKNELVAQNYEAKTFNLLQEGKIPSDCHLVLILGPTTAFFDKEILVLKNWLQAGGRMLMALDPDLKGRGFINKELRDLLVEWNIDVKHNLLIDPTSRVASAPIAGEYSKDNPIARDMQVATLFPLTSTLELKPNPPASLKTWWIAKTGALAFAKEDFKEIASGQVKLDPKKDRPGPHVVMVAVEGSQKQTTTPGTRIVALGSSHLATNNWQRFGGNFDLFLNAMSWLADDETLISIRPREESPQLPMLSQTERNSIFFASCILVPLSMFTFGGVVWVRRRKL